MKYRTIASRVNKHFTVLILSVKYYFNETVTHLQVIINLGLQNKQITQMTCFHIIILVWRNVKRWNKK